jgi:hypothetical protein
VDMPPLQASKYQPTRPNVRACYTSKKSHGTENNGMKITPVWCDHNSLAQLLHQALADKPPL